MISLSSHRWLVVAFGHALALFAAGQLNHALSPYATHLAVAGLLVAFSALRLSFRQGALSLAPVALLFDSKAPWAFGASLPVYLLLFAAAYGLRNRVRREAAAAAAATAAVLNALAFGAYTLIALAAFGPRQLDAGLLSWNLFASVAVVALGARPYFAVVENALALAGVNLAEEQRQAR